MIRTALAVCASVSVVSSVSAQNRPIDPLPLPAPVMPGENVPEPPKPAATANGIDLIRQATAVFNQAKDADPSKFLNARDLFGLAFREKVKMSPEQTAAWAYCRIKVAADKLNKSTDASTAADVITEVEGALSTVPDRLNLHEAANPVLAAARKRVGNTKPVTRTPAAIQPTESGWEAIETANFRVKYRTSKATADEAGRVAETARGDIFKKWSGPPGSNWSPKCEIVLHPTADAFAAATKLAAAATGRAEVQLSDGSATSRRIDLRADDETLIETALPRELTHIILADLYPSKPPPAWAALAMGVLSTNPDEVDRYLKTARRCARDGELLPVDKVLEAKEVPAKSVTGFHVESVALVDYLVRWKGEKAFTAFVRDAMRYGTDTALKRQYGLAGARALEDGWKRGTTPTVRGQGE
jgi:hypothetical protein